MSECQCKEELASLREELKGEIQELRAVMKFLVSSGVAAPVETTIPSRQVSMLGDAAILKIMTTKQHAAMQMWLLNGMKIAEIAKRMKCAPNTVRHHLKGMWNRLSTDNRDEIVARLMPVLDEVSDAEYLKWSGGLPKSWAATYVEGEDDPYLKLYVKSKGATNGGTT